jgi:hypothetical protein
VRALLWPLIARSALAQTATEVEGTVVEGSALTFIRFFDVGSASQCCGGHDK